MIIGLGLAGSSVARHYQEHDPSRKQHPERAFDGLLAGPELIPFRAYFAALAEHTGTGHYGRDAYASLVIWNVPTTAVHYEGSPLAVLPGVTDGHILSYTGDTAEQWFFELVKRGQTLELGVNTLLEPLADGDIGLASPEGLRRVRQATTLLEALRLLFLEFADVRPGRGMQPQYFMDVFRQFATHWVAGDVPPSGALDVDAIKRDFLLGTVDEHYLRHVQRILPALLAAERTGLIAVDGAAVVAGSAAGDARHRPRRTRGDVVVPTGGARHHPSGRQRMAPVAVRPCAGGRRPPHAEQTLPVQPAAAA